METRCTILRSATPLDIVCRCSLFDDDQGMFELSSRLHIHPEIRLEWSIDLDSGRYIEKCSTRPYGSMECRKPMIRWWYCSHKVRPHNILMGTDCYRHIFKYNSEIFELLAETMIYDFTIILSTDSCEHRSLCLGDTESVKCGLDRIWHIIP